jgi:UDP-3-O-[3-hydroxymyristoyl] N-acetylglucosamine deacetylase
LHCITGWACSITAIEKQDGSKVFNVQTRFQTTLEEAVTLEGIGLHRGVPARLVLKPAPLNSGIVFVRTDLDGDQHIPATFDRVTDTQLCTLLSNDAGATVSTVEHVMAAMAGLGLTNVIAEIDGPEIPIMDGSSAQFVDAILRVGIKEQRARRRVLRVLKAVEIEVGDASARLEPSDDFEIDFEIDFPNTPIGHQSRRMQVANGAFCDVLADSRTFVRASDVDNLRANGLALGGSLENAIVVDVDTVQNPEGFRHSDECVRHKMLDAVGDLALAGAPILGRYVGHKAGHGVTNQLLRKLFETPGAWAFEVCDSTMVASLPGVAPDYAVSA